MTDLHALDAAARERSLDPTRSVLLEAPAGSGKTTVLTQRILALLAQADEPEEVLAITFTRKAAAEMRERVLHALRDSEPVTSANARRTAELAAAARRRAAERGWSLESNPARLRIQTIDSLNHSIASRLPIAARVGGHLVVHDRAEKLHSLAARRTLEDAQSAATLQDEVGLLFERLDNDWGRFERLLAQMLGSRAHWLPLLLRAEGGSLARIVEQGLEQLAADALREACERLPAAVLAEAAAFAPLHARSIGGEVSQRLTALAGWPALLAGDVGELPWWQCLASLALTREGSLRRKLTVTSGYPPAEARLRDAAVAWIARLEDLPGAREALFAIAALPALRLDGADVHALDALARVLKFAAAELELTFQEQGRVDHACVAAAARRALTEDGHPTDLALRLGSSIRHILVDEFQDTSNEQYELLRALTAGWERGDGRTLFAVGDPMQSIYQFREAEVGLFLRTRRHGLGELRLETLRLTRNFRSLPALVEFGNETFSRIFPPVDEPRSSAVRHAPSLAARSAAGEAVLGFHLTRPGEVNAEARAVVRLVEQMRQRAPGGSIAILVAARSHAAPLTRALLAASIPVAGIDLVPLAQVPVVRDLAALTCALDHRGDRSAWLAILRAPWCGLKLADLALLADRSDAATVWERLCTPAVLESLSADAQPRLRRFCEVMGRALAAAGRLAPAPWVESTWLALGGPSACREAAELGHADSFLRALAQRSAEPDWSGPQELEELLGSLYAGSTGAPADAVQVMTMHRAKGLEFDRVILPSLGRRRRSSPEPLLRWLDLPREIEGSDLLLAPAPSASRRSRDPLNQFLKGLQKRRADFELVRLLYVATTRARFELHLLGATDVRHPDRPGSGTLLELLWESLGTRFLASAQVAQPPPAQAAAPAAAAIAAAGPPGRTIRRLAAGWELPATPHGIGFSGLRVANYEPVAEIEFDWAGQTARHVGTVVHGALERLARERELPTPQQLDALRPALLAGLAARGVVPGELEQATELVAEALRATLADPRGRWILDPAHDAPASELGLSGILAGRLVSVAIDRTFIDAEGQRWVIDFKTGMHRGGSLETFLEREVERYRPQLEKYAALARHLGPQPVRAALYFPLLGAFRECPLP